MTYLFNPDNDLALANGDTNYLPPQSARRMAEDLALLPAWYAQTGDTVLIPDSSQLHYWQETSLPSLLPEGIKFVTEREPLPDDVLSPWGWNPALIKRLKTRGASPSQLPDEHQMAELRRLSGRQTAVRVLRALMEELGSAHPLIGESHLCTSEEEVARWVNHFPRTLLKAPWSGSGKGLRRGKGTYAPPLSGWCKRILSQQGAVVTEPIYNKVYDFAMEFDFKGDGASVRFTDYSLFATNANGAYEGNVLTGNAEIEKQLSHAIPLATLRAVQLTLTRLLGEEIAPSSYQGFVGVDMMTVQEGDRFLLHPCVEVNLRMTMGMVSRLFHHRFVAPHRTGMFRIAFHPTPETLREEHLRLTKAHPLTLTPDGRIEHGYLSLTPIGRNTCYSARVVVE